MKFCLLVAVLVGLIGCSPEQRPEPPPPEPPVMRADTSQSADTVSGDSMMARDTVRR